VVRDFAGFSTYDSCYRAKEVFGVRRAVLVTQGFHLPRALFIANSLGMEANGVAADENALGPLIYEGREVFSRTLAWVMVLARPSPRFLGEKVPIGTE
jgi:SanA protein